MPDIRLDLSLSFKSRFSSARISARMFASLLCFDRISHTRTCTSQHTPQSATQEQPPLLDQQLVRELHQKLVLLHEHTSITQSHLNEPPQSLLGSAHTADHIPNRSHSASYAPELCPDFPFNVREGNIFKETTVPAALAVTVKRQVSLTLSSCKTSSRKHTDTVCALLSLLLPVLSCKIFERSNDSEVDLADSPLSFSSPGNEDGHLKFLSLLPVVRALSPRPTPSPSFLPPPPPPPPPQLSLFLDSRLLGNSDRTGRSW
eukprot:749446-Hanusia_phi.AAC.1